MVGAGDGHPAASLGLGPSALDWALVGCWGCKSPWVPRDPKRIMLTWVGQDVRMGLPEGAHPQWEGSTASCVGFVVNL